MNDSDNASPSPSPYAPRADDFTPPPTAPSAPTAQTAPPPPPGPIRAPLRRASGDSAVLGGVAAGVARWLGIDPILVRIVFVLLAIFGGSGILIYLAGWLFIPQEGRTDSSGERFLRDSNAWVIAAAVVVGVLVVGPMLAWGLWGDGPGFGGLVLLFLVIAAVVALVKRTPSSTEPSAAPAAPAAPFQPAPAESTTPTQVLPTGEGVPSPSSAPPRERSVLGLLTVGLTLVTVGTLVALDVGDVINVGAVTVVAAALGVVAAGLLVGTFVGRSRALIALGVALVLVLIPLGAVPDDVRWNVGAGVGDPVYRVTSIDDLQPTYELGAGELTLDLRRLDVTEPVSIDASLGVGELIVLLPEDVPVTADVDVAVGTIGLPGERALDGVDLQQTWERLGDPTALYAGSLDLTLSTGFGAVTVIDDDQEVTR